MIPIDMEAPVHEPGRRPDTSVGANVAKNGDTQVCVRHVVCRRHGMPPLRCAGRHEVEWAANSPWGPSPASARFLICSMLG